MNVKKPQTIAVIGAMNEEIEILKSTLNSTEECDISSFDYYVGEYAGHRVIVAKSDIGKVNAAIITSLLINEFHPDVIINTGSAGGLSAKVKVGDVIIGETFSYHDVDVRAFNYEYGQVPGLPKAFSSNPRLIDTAKEAARVSKLTTHIGLICSGDSFISDNKRINEIREYFPEILAVEMESTAVAQTCHRLNTPYIIIRSISDNANDDAHVDFYEFLKTASKHSAEFVLNIIERL